MKRNLIANLAFHVHILGLNLSLVIYLWHDNLPSYSVLDLSGHRSDWKQRLELNSECQSNERILDILIQLNSARSAANALSIRLIKDYHSLRIVQISPSIMNSNVNSPPANADHLGGILQITVFDSHHVSQELLELFFKFNRADQAEIVQEDSLFYHSFDRRLYLKRQVIALSWLRKLTVISVETRDDFIGTDNTVLGH